VVKFGSFPSNKSISVQYSGQDHRFSGQFKIILPFFFASASLSNGFVDFVLDDSAINAGVNYALLGGNPTSRAAIDLLSLLPDRGFVVAPSISYDFSGRSVSNAGDVDGDGNDDLIIGVPGVSMCYVLMGTSRGWVNMTQGFTVFGGDGDNMGWSVSGAGDPTAFRFKSTYFIYCVAF
jgi:hypothetical protein